MTDEAKTDKPEKGKLKARRVGQVGNSLDSERQLEASAFGKKRTGR